MRYLIFILSVFFFACSDAPQDSQEEISTSLTGNESDMAANVEVPNFSIRLLEIDKKVFSSPTNVANNIQSLSNHLSSFSKTDLEKARAIFTWLAENISYDDRGYNTGQYGDGSAESTLQSRQSVCEGFANLFVALGEQMDLQVKKVSGFAKGFGYAAGRNMTRPNHAWNLVLIDDQWKIMDATWGQGSGKAINGKLVSTKAFDDYWFDVHPHEAIFNHYPENMDDALIDLPISLNQYWDLPKVEKLYFEYGFDGKSAFNMSLEDRRFETPTCYTIKENKLSDIYFEVAPVAKIVKRGAPINFSCKTKSSKKIALIDANNEFHFFDNNNDSFTLNFTPKKAGPIRIAFQSNFNETQYDMVLGYEAE